MGRYFSGAGSEFLTLEAASERDITWDVFVSHTTEDDELAEEVAKCVRSFGLSAWVDSDHLDSKHDGPGMASTIQGVIRRSYCLLAVVTSATNESWWVPFEIGVAFDRDRYLSTYGDPQVSLPSFLAAWPRVRDHSELHLWEYAVHTNLPERPGYPISINISNPQLVTSKGVEFIQPPNERITLIQ